MSVEWCVTAECLRHQYNAAIANGLIMKARRLARVYGAHVREHQCG